MRREEAGIIGNRRGSEIFGRFRQRRLYIGRRWNIWVICWFHLGLDKSNFSQVWVLTVKGWQVLVIDQIIQQPLSTPPTLHPPCLIYSFSRLFFIKFPFSIFLPSDFIFSFLFIFIREFECFVVGLFTYASSLGFSFHLPFIFYIRLPFLSYIPRVFTSFFHFPFYSWIRVLVFGTFTSHR